MFGSDHKGLSGGRGSVLTVSNTALTIQPSVSALINADSSMTPPRAILIKYAWGGSDRNIHLYERLGYKIFKSEEINPNLSFVLMEKHK